MIVSILLSVWSSAFSVSLYVGSHIQFDRHCFTFNSVLGNQTSLQLIKCWRSNAFGCQYLIVSTQPFSHSRIRLFIPISYSPTQVLHYLQFSDPPTPYHLTPPTSRCAPINFNTVWLIQGCRSSWILDFDRHLVSWGVTAWAVLDTEDCYVLYCSLPCMFMGPKITASCYGSSCWYKHEISLRMHILMWAVLSGRVMMSVDWRIEDNEVPVLENMKLVWKSNQSDILEWENGWLLTIKYWQPNAFNCQHSILIANYQFDCQGPNWK